MPTPLSPSEQLVYCTVRIECETAGGISSGTGFFFHFLDNGSAFVPALVTNKHVVAGARRGKIHLHRQGPDGGPSAGEHQAVIIEDFEKFWFGHPDPTCDLCIMPIAGLLERGEREGTPYFYKGLDSKLIPSPVELTDLSALEDVIMIGYPNGIWDSVNNMPITRRGVTATHPNLNYEGRSEFMIDAACFPGSSGSPVILYSIGGYQTREKTVLGGSRIKLLGILYAGPVHTATGEVKIVTVPTVQVPIAVSQIPNNLGLVIKSSRLADFESVLVGLANDRGMAIPPSPMA